MRRMRLIPTAGLVACAIALTSACSPGETNVPPATPDAADATTPTQVAEPEPTPTPAPEPAPTSESEPTAVPAPTSEAPQEVEVEEPVEPAEPEEAEEAERGTRQNPGIVGQDIATLSIGEDEVTVSLAAATWDADALVADENQFNDPPGEGMVYVLLPVTVGYSGPDSIVPWLEVDVVHLAEDGRSYESSFSSIPDDLSDINDLYDGGEATGNILFELPADQVPGGLWGVSRGFSGDALWFDAAS